MVHQLRSQAVGGSTSRNTLGSGVSRCSGVPPVSTVIARLPSRTFHLERMEGILRASDTEWTVLRPPYLTDEPATGRYRTAVDASVPGGGLPRGDLARAMLDVLAEAATVRAALGVGPGGR